MADETANVGGARLPFYVEQSQDGAGMVHAWSTVRLPCEPKGWLGDFREALRTALAGLQAGPGQLLHAVYTSPQTDRCDTENILFYNVGQGPFARAAREGLRFERAYETLLPCPVPLATQALHHHRYAFAAAEAPFRHWTLDSPIVRWGPLAAPKRAFDDPAALWYVLKTTRPDLLPPPAAPLRRFGLRVTVGLPTGTPFQPAGRIKSLFDGAISALHQYAGTQADVVSARLAQELTVSPAEIRALLLSPQAAVLGPAPMVYLTARSVGWIPQDELCLAGELRLVRHPGSGPWTLTAEVFSIRPRPDTQHKG